MSCRTRTNVTISVPTSDIPASEPMIRRGSSEAASVYRPTMPIRKPIWAGVIAIDTSTTAIGHRRRSTSTEPANSPNTTPAATGIPASRANGIPSTAHSTADATRQPHVQHRTAPPGPTTTALPRPSRGLPPSWSCPPAYGRRAPLFR